MPLPESKSFTLLAVDDAPTNLAVLVDNLTTEHCRVLTAESAESALRRLDHVIPDIILLDVMMPEMDGFTLCRKLKQQPLFRDIPVIFLTARNETDDILEGFHAGGVDYITKPFRKEELSMRINTHLELKHARQQIQQYALTLEERNKKLSELLNEKNEFIGVATHDLRNPLSILNLALDLFQIKTQGRDMKDVEPLIDQMRATVARMTTLVSKLVEINRLDVGRYDLNLEKLDLHPLCEQIVRDNQVAASAKSIKIHYESDSAVQALADVSAFTQVIDNLISNAVKYSPRETQIWCRLAIVGNAEDLPDLILMDRKVRFSVRDEGPGIHEHDKAKLFKRFSKTSNQPTAGEGSSGLGLSIAKRLAREMQGDIGFVSKSGEGSVFYLELPYRNRD